MSIFLDNDIRMTALQIPTPLLSASIQVPYVDRLGDGETGFLFSVKQYIGGYDGDDVSGYVPGKHSLYRSKRGFEADMARKLQPSSVASAAQLSSSPPSFRTMVHTKRSPPHRLNTLPKSKTSSSQIPFPGPA